MSRSPASSLVNTDTGFVIAGVRFSFTGASPTAAFPTNFAPFADSHHPHDLASHITIVGPDPALDTQCAPADTAWAFAADHATCQVTRYNAVGNPLWRLVGNPEYSAVTVTWSPTTFTPHYGAYHDAWSKGLGLVHLGLALRLHNGFMLHGVAAAIDGHGLLGLGVSGVGKSTLARLLMSAGHHVLTDERPALRYVADAFHVHGTPWPSSANAISQGCAPLRRIFFLQHGNTNKITPLDHTATLRRLIPVATVPWQTPRLLDPYLATIENLVRRVPSAILEFRPDAAVIDLLRHHLHP